MQTVDTNPRDLKAGQGFSQCWAESCCVTPDCSLCCSRRDLEIERPVVGLNEDTVNTLT